MENEKETTTCCSIGTNIMFGLIFLAIVIISVIFTFAFAPGYDSIYIDTPTMSQASTLLKGNDELRITNVKLSPTTNPCITKLECDIKFQFPWIKSYYSTQYQLDDFVKPIGVKRLTDYTGEQN